MPYGDRTPTVSELMVQVAQLKAQLAAVQHRPSADAMPSADDLLRMCRLLDALAARIDEWSAVAGALTGDGRRVDDEVRALAALLPRYLPPALRPALRSP